MIDLLALIFLTWHLGKAAEKKGLSSIKWRTQNVLAWFACEFLGVMFGYFILGNKDILGLSLLGMISGVGGYLLVQAKLKRTPDADIDM